MLSVGLAIYVSWWLAVIVLDYPSGMLSALSTENQLSHNPVFAMVALSFQTVALAFMAATDQKLLLLYSSRVTLVAASVVTTLGTLAATIFAAFDISFAGCSLIHSLIGIGSAFLLMFWGVAYSRQNLRSILLCTPLAIFIVFIVLIALSVLPEPLRMTALGIMPMLDLFFLWNCTPISYAVRHSIPIFNPLPVNASFFLLRLTVPTIFLGIASGMFLNTTMPPTLMTDNIADSVFIVILAGLVIAILISIVSLLSTSGSLSEHLLRIAILGIAFCAPSLLFSEHADSWFLIPATAGCMLLLTISWAFCGYIAQSFRISPIFIFSIVNCGISFGLIANNIIAEPIASLSAQAPYGESAKLAAALMCLMLVEVLLPRPHDIKRVAASGRKPNNANAVTQLNRQLQSIIKAGSREGSAENPNNEDLARLDNRCRAEGKSPESSRIVEGGAAENQDTDFFSTDASGELVVPMGRFRLRCEAIANRHMLSGRETEVLFLLAKGYSTNRITEELYISKNTAKTHIAHIYRKLHIHSRQELQEIIDSSEKPSEQAADNALL